MKVFGSLLAISQTVDDAGSSDFCRKPEKGRYSVLLLPLDAVHIDSKTTLSCQCMHVLQPLLKVIEF
jgi:hypothetical protein